MNNGIYELSDDGKTLLGVKDKKISEAVIPDGVTHIGDKAFDCCLYLQCIDIPNSVTHIGEKAFSGFLALQSIEVAEGNQYFASTDGVLFSKDLTQIYRYPEEKNGSKYTIPDGVTHIGEKAFYGCRDLQCIDIPNSVIHIGNEAFCRCKALQSIEVVEGNQYFASIDGVLFSKDLTQIIRYPQAKYGNQYTIPDSVTHIGDWVFSRCKTLQSIDIPNSMTHIGDWAFSGCEALQSIDIPNSVTHIGNKAFFICEALQNIDIPNSVTHIGDRAFSGCKALQSIEVAESNQYFASTDGVLFSKDLTQIICYPQAKNGNQYTIPNSVTHIGDGAFSECKSLQSIVIPNSVTHIGNEAFCWCKAFQSIDIPNSVTHIGNRAFVLCKSLQSIDIPNSVTHIGNETFNQCWALQSIDVAEGNQYFISIDGVLFNKDLTQIIRYPQAKNGNQYTIPNSVTHIGDEAFSGCKALQSINIPNNVTYIGDWAFSGCNALQSIDIPNSVTHIGDLAFSYCEALQSIDIPNSVTYIGDDTFSRCKALQSIHIRITDIDSCCVNENAFYDIDVDNCILYIPSGTRWAYRHHPVFRNFKNIEIERIK